MRWMIIALVLTTVLYAQFVGSANLYVWDMGDCTVLFSDNRQPQVVKKDERVYVLAGFLSEYIDEEDAIRTARRYCNDNEQDKRLKDPEMWTAMTIAESGGDSEAVSPVGAQGKLQVMPSWKRKKGFEFYRGRYSHLNDDLNYKAAKKIMADNLDDTHNNKWLSVERYCGTGPDARAYRNKVHRIYLTLRKATKHCVT